MLEIKNLQLEFRSEHQAVRAVDGVSFSIAPGETLGLVGESGSGKSVTALSIGRLLRTPPAFYAGGEILLEGRDVLKATDRELRDLRGRGVSYVFQEPGASLNPVVRVGAPFTPVPANRNLERDHFVPTPGKIVAAARAVLSGEAA